MQAQVSITQKSYWRGSEEETIHKHYTAAESEECDTIELCNTCLSLQQVSANIDAFPSAIVLQREKPEDHNLEKKNSSPTPLPHSQTEHLTKAEKRRLDSISCLDSLNYQASWNVLSPCCPGGAIFIPVQPLCSSTCHLHSVLPEADLLTASEREGSHNTSSKEEVYLCCSCHYVPQYSCAIKINVCGNWSFSQLQRNSNSLSRRY